MTSDQVRNQLVTRGGRRVYWGANFFTLCPKRFSLGGFAPLVTALRQTRKDHLRLIRIKSTVKSNPD